MSKNSTSKQDAAAQANTRRLKNKKECRSILRYIDKNGVSDDGIVVRIQDMLKAYIDDLTYEQNG